MGRREGGQVPHKLSKIFTYNIVHWYILEYGGDKVAVWWRRKVKSEDRDQREGKIK